MEPQHNDPTSPVLIAPPGMSSMEATLRAVEENIENGQGWDSPPILCILTMLEPGTGVAPPGSRMVGAASFPLPPDFWEGAAPVAALYHLAEIYRTGAADITPIRDGLQGRFAGLVLSTEVYARLIPAETPVTNTEELQADYAKAVADGRWDEAPIQEMRQVVMVTPGGALLAAMRTRGEAEVEVQDVTDPGDSTKALIYLTHVLVHLISGDTCGCDDEDEEDTPPSSPTE